MSPLAYLLAQELPAQIVTKCGVEEPGWLASQVCEETGSEGWTKATEFLLGRPATVVTIVIIAWVANRLARRGIRKIVAEMQEPEKRELLGRLRQRTGMSQLTTGRTPSLRAAQRAQAIGALLRSAASVIIWGTAVVMVLAEIGVAIGPLLASAGIVGVALGFGAQSLVKDVLSGIFMLVEDQYGVGDIIDAGEAAGVVEGIGLRTTRLRSVEGTLWHIPNGEITRVGNFSQEWARALLDVGVAYDTDIDHASAVIKDVADEVWQDPEWSDAFLEEPEVWGVELLGDSSISIRLVIKTKPAEQWKLSRELRRRIKQRFDTEGIEIPFPQRTMWLRREPGESQEASPT